MRKNFRIETVLVITGEYLISDMVEVIELLEYMMGRKLHGDLDMFYARTLCRKAILKKHPFLELIDFSGLKSIDNFVNDPRGAKTFVDTWLEKTLPEMRNVMIHQLDIAVPEVTQEGIDKIYRGAKKFYESENRN